MSFKEFFASAVGTRADAYQPWSFGRWLATLLVIPFLILVGLCLCVLAIGAIAIVAVLRWAYRRDSFSKAWRESIEFWMD